MNLILENTEQVPYFTNLRTVLEALNVAATKYDWYVSDVETNRGAADFALEDRWLSGDDLHVALSRHDIQFIWAVFSAFPKGCHPTVVHAPCADGNLAYWDGSALKPQLEGALFEIACWDSSATILIGIPERAAISFKQTFPDAKPLSNAGVRESAQARNNTARSIKSR